jgi:alpha-galactosidase
MTDRDSLAVVAMRPLHDGSVTVGLFNRGDQPQEINVKWEALDLAGKKLQVRDLWKHQGVQPGKDGYATTVPAHGVTLLRVSAGR